MSFTLAELQDWLREAGVKVALRGADGASTAASIGALRCRAAVTDSRAVEAGVLFCAVQGETMHGVRFLQRALEAGASAALVEGPAPTLPGYSAPVLEVADARLALAAAARGWLRRHRPRVIGITGSNGKTTTKDFLGAALGGELAVSVSPGNLNSQWGLPLAVLGFRGDEQWLVLEMGASAPDEIGRLAAIARPWMGCVTNVAPAHLEGFGSIEAVLRTKGQLLQALPADGVAVINADDPRVEELAALSGAGRIVRFGRAPGADVRIEEVATTASGLRVRIDGCSAVLPVFGEMNASNAAAAMAMARHCGVSGERALERISRARLSPHRGRSCECGGRIVIDDSYNANPASMRQALDSLATWPGAQRRVAVLADMGELGSASTALHGEVLDHALRRGLDLVIVAGPRFAEAAAGVTGSRVVAFDRVDVGPIVDCLEERTRADDLVLVKGSRSAGLERVVDAMAARFSGVITNGETNP